MSELAWSLAGTHCVWCRKRRASGADESRHDAEREARDIDCDSDTCWCPAVCWGTCRESVFDERTVGGLRALVEAQAAVIARLRDGWRLPLTRSGWWTKYDRRRGEGGIADEPMTPAEQFVLYGEVVRTEETDRD